MKYLYLIGAYLLLSSCFPAQVPLSDNSGDTGVYIDPNPPPIEREEDKEPDPVKQGECRSRGRSSCEGDEDCEEICDDIFKRRSDRQDCYEFSQELVEDFETLISATEDGDVETIEEIGDEVLECMLDIDERAFAQAVKDMSKRETKNFILMLSENEDFTEVLEDEDDEFNILKQIFHELSGSSNLERALSQEVDDDKTFLWLAGESNKYLWKWMDGYVDDECNGRNSSDCPGGENLGAYCNALQNSNFSRSDWEDFLSDASLFADEYEEEVEDDNFEYDITNSPDREYYGDFRDFCRFKLAVESQDSLTISGNCPKTTSIYPLTFETGPEDGQTLYRTQHVRFGKGPAGTVTPEDQDIIVKIDIKGDATGCSHCRIHLDVDAISYDRSRKYYIYLRSERGDTQRIDFMENNWDYGLIDSQSLNDLPNFVKPYTDEIYVAVAAEYDNQCVFYLP